MPFLTHEELVNTVSQEAHFSTGLYMHADSGTNLGKLINKYSKKNLQITLRDDGYIQIMYSAQQGRIQDFHWGGGAKIMCPHAHYERGTKLAFGRVQGPLNSPGSSRVAFMLSRAI